MTTPHEWFADEELRAATYETMFRPRLFDAVATK